jgi:hypothetical protein
MPNLKPFRNYSEHDVINLYAYLGEAPVSKGTLVSPINTWSNNDGGVYQEPTDMTSTLNAVSARFDVIAEVTATPTYNTVPAPFGIILKDVREVDENGEYLIYNPRKLAEMDAVLPNQAVPILTKGIVFINDFDLTDRGAGGGLPDVGDAAYAGDDGKIATDGIVVVGKFLSTVDDEGYALVKLDL